MTVSPFDSAIFGRLFADPKINALFSDEAAIRSMLTFEAVLAAVEARLGIIPEAAAEAIERTAAGLTPDMDTIAAGTHATGVPVVPLVEQLRAAVGGEAATYVHWGATSQDVIDTGLVLRLHTALDLMTARLELLIDRLVALADAHRATVMAARTRWQQAVPTSFGLKAATWLQGLAAARDRLTDMRPRLLTVQFGGAAGTLSALGDKGVAVMEALARELDLAVPVAPWPSRREAMAEFAGALSQLTGVIGKMGQDLMLLAQSEVAEVRPGAGGDSSTMPQKANPVGCEVMVTASRLNATLVSAVHQALIQEHERGGPGWQLEWLSLPQMVACAGGALHHALAVTTGLEIDADRMRANLDASNGLILAEAAGFALAAHMPREAAQALVKDACRKVVSTGRPLMEVLPDMTDAPVDWTALADPAGYLGDADALIDRIIAAARNGSAAR
ncbi:MAG: 3-carboxy-cis,cis-muconate cycloisomerase [Rhodospirillales bacterium]|nr:MAG: 3-carboxy-cis,cis-muconate cycloisomerase [Rhodospirillales bacterium]